MNLTGRHSFVAAFLLLLAGSEVLADSAVSTKSGAAETADDSYLAPVAVTPLGENSSGRTRFYWMPVAVAGSSDKPVAAND